MAPRLAEKQRRKQIVWNVIDKEVRPFTFSRGDGSRTRRPLTEAERRMCVEQAIITMARSGVGGDVYMAVIALLSDGSKVRGTQQLCLMRC